MTRLEDLIELPQLVVLVSAETVGLAAGLCELGIPAVLGMNGNASVDTIRKFMPVLFRSVLRDGNIDRAVGLARGAIRERADVWGPVLYMGLDTSRLW